jgi:hypothetical protein
MKFHLKIEDNSDLTIMDKILGFNGTW